MRCSVVERGAAGRVRGSDPRPPRPQSVAHTCTGSRLLNHCLTYFGFSRKSILWPGPITLPMCFALLRTRCGGASSICFETSRRPSANCMHSSAWAAPPFQNISALFVQQASCDNPNAAPASSTASCQDNSARSCAGFASMQIDLFERLHVSHHSLPAGRQHAIDASSHICASGTGAIEALMPAYSTQSTHCLRHVRVQLQHRSSPIAHHRITKWQRCHPAVTAMMAPLRITAIFIHVVSPAALLSCLSHLHHLHLLRRKTAGTPLMCLQRYVHISPCRLRRRKQRRDGFSNPRITRSVQFQQ